MNVREQFVKDVADHTIRLVTDVIKMTDGGAVQEMDKRYVCRAPASSNCWFTVIAWNYGLLIHGDHGTFAFQTGTLDMLALFKGADRSYIMGKCVAWSSPKTKFSEQRFYALLNETEADDDPRIRLKVEEIRCAYAEYESEHDAMKAMYESGIWGPDLPDCTEYDYDFLWCVEAIKWLVERI